MSLTTEEEEEIIDNWINISKHNINPEMTSLDSTRNYLNRYHS
ncbi:hypothetical protein SAMN04488124_2498 [Halogeometricum limi]|uniref:Uncharacterized protein n=1 Tax=Halogeometricum limi TaxID=555875 RepID=A0A1I6HV58_9EURY|nr:hypothetical protein SAMN04488124_2498 [Halogeometricum limi]